MNKAQHKSQRQLKERAQQIEQEWNDTKKNRNKQNSSRQNEKTTGQNESERDKTRKYDKKQ